MSTSPSTNLTARASRRRLVLILAVLSVVGFIASFVVESGISNAQRSSKINAQEKKSKGEASRERPSRGEKEGKRWSKAELRAAGYIHGTVKVFKNALGQLVTVRTADKTDVSPPMRSMKIILTDEVEEKGEDDRGAPGPVNDFRHDPDPVLQQFMGSGVFNGGNGDIPSPGANFAGMTNTSSIAPPDPNGEIGPNHYVQMVNVRYQIFNRAGGSLFGPANINTLWAGFGGPCQTENAGDPVVLYDQISDRWVLSQFTAAGPTFFNCIAVSQTADPLGAYFRYAITTGTNFPDYPKYGVWPDAYYISTREFSSAGPFAGVGAYALNRTLAIVGGGQTISMLFPPGATPYLTGDGLLPSDLDGTTLPPAGAPNYYVGSMDAGGPYGAPTDALNLFKFHADFAVPVNSSFTFANQLNTAAFDSVFPCTPSARECIPQPGTATKVDILSYRQRPLFRLAYRNFGTRESLVTNQSVEATPGVAGVRWWEIRSPNSSPFISQEGTYSPDSVNRWMGSIAQDRDGNMLLGYSVSDATTVSPGIRYTGRLFTDPLGTMPQGEGTLVAGAGSQTAGANRWGDYSDMTVDPLDDCTFWYTTEYYTATSGATWATRIGSIKFPTCGLASPTAIISSGASPVITAEGNTPANNAPDPGEAITATFTLQNVGNANTTNLVATLQNSGGVTAIPAGENQNYGVVVAGGPTVSRPFTFRANGTCGGTITVTLTLQDGANNLGTVTYNFQLGTTSTSTSFTENFDGVTPPALPAGWTTAVTGSGVAFVVSATNPNSAPNDAFAPDIATLGTSELVSVSIPITFANSQVTFNNLYNTESTFDGLVLEISNPAVNGGAFQDILAAGGSFASGGYNGGIVQSGTCTDPLNGRQAWNGLSGGTAAAPTYITSVVNLPASANGQSIKLKWLLGHDCSVAPTTNPGVRIDGVTVSVQSPVCAPTATATISGTIARPSSSPVGGVVVRMTGGQTRAAITDASGNYHFDSVPMGSVGNSYTLTPALANFTFAPVNRGYTPLVGNVTDATFTANADAGQTANAIDTSEFFVRQHYLDFLGREPDQGGLDYWSGQINQCGANAACTFGKRIDVSAAFFISGEFQDTGSFVYNMYAALLGRTVSFNEFSTDRALVVGGGGLDAAKTAFAQAYVQRAEFTTKYPLSLTRDQFVDAVILTMQTRSGGNYSSLQAGLRADYDASGRWLVARHAAEASGFVTAEYNKAFVLMQYYGYLRRGIDQGGYDFWLNVLNINGNNFRGMVCSFLTSAEYQNRFSSVVTHTNAECAGIQ